MSIKLEKLKDLTNLKTKELKELFVSHDKIQIFLFENGFRVVNGPKKVKKFLSRKFNSKESRIEFKDKILDMFELNQDQVNDISFKTLKEILKMISE